MLLEQAGLQHHLGQLLHKQRHPVGLGYHLRHDLRWQRLAVGHTVGHLRRLLTRQARQRHLGEMRAPRPGRVEVGPKGPQRQDARGGALIDQHGEEFQGGRIDPVQVFHDKEHRLLGGNAHHDGQESMQGLLLLLLGRRRQGGIVVAQRQGEEGGKQGHGLRQRQTILDQEPFQFAQLLLGGLLALKVQRHPLQQINQGIQGAVLVIRGTLTRRQPCLGLGGHLVRQHLHQARFANPRFAAEQYDLAHTVFDVLPTLLEQPDLLLAAHQWGPPRGADRLQATAGHALIEHAIDRQRLRLAFQERCP